MGTALAVVAAAAIGVAAGAGVAIIGATRVLGRRLRQRVDREMAQLRSEVVAEEQRTRIAVERLADALTDQAWFWTKEWQAGEREADEDLAAGRTTRFESAEDMDTFLAGIAYRTTEHARN